MNCEEFLIVFEERGGLTEAATLHLKICVDCQKLEKTQTRIWRMIDDFKSVDAPANFDFAVKARIKNAHQPQKPRIWFSPALRFAVPLGLVVLILGFVAFSASYFSGNSAPQTASVAPQTPIEKDAPPSNVYVVNQNAADANPIVAQANSTAEKPKENGEIAIVKPSTEQRGTASKKTEREFDGGSRVSASTQGAPKFPNGLNPNRANVAPMNIGGGKSFAASEILSFIGIESAPENGKLQVKAIKPDSLAERSGVRVGDIIEAINNLPLNELGAKRIEGKTLTVARGAERIVINLRN